MALMLATKALTMGIKVTILSEHETDPAIKAASKWLKGSTNDIKLIKKLCKCSDVVTYESEFVDPKVQEKLFKYVEKVDSACIYPSPQIMLLLSDRLSQKNLLAKYKIPTSPFFEVGSGSGSLKEISRLGYPCVIKARRGGYDGKGTYIAKRENDKKLFSFVQNLPAGAIAEGFIPFKKELAISLARTPDGAVQFLPLVETKQEDYRCLWVKGPIESHPALTSLKSKLKKFVEGTGYVGLISFELFDTGKELLVNEIAPRVHNSAHYSQNALTVDQFEMHLRAILNADLPSPKSLAGGFAMYNLIGSNEKEPVINYHSSVFTHWYGKSQNRKGRKMGHINALGSSASAALSKVKKARKDFKL